MHRFSRAVMAASLLFAVAAFGAAADLAPGSTAPPLDVVKWYKGAPIEKLDPSKTYVVEFWATWCGPCIESMPHLTDLAKKNPDVVFIGVDAFEAEKDNNVAKFVVKMGDKMDYTVAYSGDHVGMAKSWMDAAHQDGIPTAFMVKNNTILWIGHPDDLEKQLDDLKQGHFDLAASKQKFESESAAAMESENAEKALAGCSALYKQGEKDKAKLQLDQAEKKYPLLAYSAAFQRFQWLAEEYPKAWETLAREKAASKTRPSLDMLLRFAIRQSTKKGAAFERGKLALQLAEDSTSWTDYTALQYGSSFYNFAGDPRAELIYVNKLLALILTPQYKGDPEVAKTWQDRKAELEAKLKG